MRIIFFDTETTGIGADDRLCQLAVKERGSAVAMAHALYKPPVPIPPAATAIHRITNEMVQERPSFLAAPEYAELKSLFESDDTVIAAHNIAFDAGMLAREGVVPRQTVCTWKVARALDVDKKLEQYSLQYLRGVLGIEVEAPAHDALGDVLVLEILFERLYKKLIEREGSGEAALTEMLAISARPVLFTTLRFGKHKGKKIEEVARLDPSYLEWLLAEKKKSPAAEADWIHTLEHYLSKNPPTN